MNKEEIKKIILNSFSEKKNSHAFLFVTNNLDKCNKYVLDILKKINCKNEGSNTCDCQVCRLTNAGNNPDIINLSPVGKEYKVDQINELMDMFKTNPLFCSYKSYVINEADLLGTLCSNKLLKFLEEPEANIVGFYITNNLQGMLNTIQSRCEIFFINFDTLNILDALDISEVEFDKYYNRALELIFMLNDSPKYALMIESKKLTSLERDEMIKLIKILKNMYIIKYQVMMNEIETQEYMNAILDNIATNDIKIVVKRIKILDNILNDLKFNVNKELIFNKLFLMWE